MQEWKDKHAATAQALANAQVHADDARAMFADQLQKCEQDKCTALKEATDEFKKQEAGYIKVQSEMKSKSEKLEEVIRKHEDEHKRQALALADAQSAAQSARADLTAQLQQRETEHAAVTDEVEADRSNFATTIAHLREKHARELEQAEQEQQQTLDMNQVSAMFF